MTTFTAKVRDCNKVQQGQTILEFTDDDETSEGERAVALIHVQRNVENSPPRVIIFDKGANAFVKISGIALAALRDAINTLPSEAFVDPEPAWVEGDTVVFVGTEFTSTWTRQADGAWTGVRAYAKSADSSWAGSARRVPPAQDRLIDTWLETNRVSVIRRGGVDL